MSCGSLYYFSVAIMISGLFGFIPGVWWSWLVSSLIAFCSTGMFLILILSDDSKHLDHPDPKVSSAVRNAMDAVANNGSWLAEFIALFLVTAYAATGHLSLAIIIALSSILVVFARLKAKEAIEKVTS